MKKKGKEVVQVPIPRGRKDVVVVSGHDQELPAFVHKETGKIERKV